MLGSGEASPIHFLGLIGGSGSGKTALAKEIQSQLQQNLLCISQDYYYVDLHSLPLEKRNTFNFDHPDAFNMDLFCSDLDQLKSGKVIQVPQYDYGSCVRSGYQPSPPPTSLVIIEGLFLLHEPTLRQRLDFSCFIEADEEIRVQRRIARDLKERGKPLSLIQKMVKEFVLPMHNQFIEPSKKFANLIQTNNQNSPSHLTQLAQKIIQHFSLENLFKNPHSKKGNPC